MSAQAEPAPINLATASTEETEAAFEVARGQFDTQTTTSETTLSCSAKPKPPATKPNPRCRHQGLSATCSHGRSPAVLPAWAVNADPASPNLVLQVLAEDSVKASAKVMAGPCGSHRNLIHIDAEGAKSAGTSGSFKAEGPEISWIDDIDYILWPSPGRCSSSEITAESCSGATDPPLIVQVFPKISNQVSLAIQCGDTSADQNKPGGGSQTYETTWESGISIAGQLSVNDKTVSLTVSTTDETSRFRQFPKLCSSVGGATGWLAEQCSRLGGCEIKFLGPNAKLTGEWGWKEDTSCACGFEFSGSVSADPLFGLSVEKDIAPYVLAVWPAALALKETLEKTDSGEIQILLGAETTCGGELKGTKLLAQGGGTFDGNLNGTIEISATGKAEVEKEIFWVTVSVGMEVELTAGLKVSLNGKWDADNGPGVSASVSFTGLKFTACGWIGPNSSVETNSSKSRDQSSQKKELEFEWEAIPPKDDFLSTSTWYPFR